MIRLKPLLFWADFDLGSEIEIVERIGDDLTSRGTNALLFDDLLGLGIGAIQVQEGVLDERTSLWFEEGARLAHTGQTTYELLKKVLICNFDLEWLLTHLASTSGLPHGQGSKNVGRCEEVWEKVEQLVPLLALLFQREDRNEHWEDLEVEHEVEQVLGRSLLACHLEIALLQALKVIHAVVSQKV